jgi:hypothetical protein
MWLRKEQGGSSIGPHEWPEDGSVTEVPDHFGRTLLAIPDGGFTEVPAPDPEAPGDEEDSHVPDGDQDPGDGDSDGSAGDDGETGDPGEDKPKTTRQRKTQA